MFHDLLEPFAKEFSGKRAWRMVSELWQFRNTVMTPGLRDACRYCVRRFREAGADSARTIPYPADGKTKYGATTMPLEWRPRSATLSIVRPAEHARRLTSFEEEALSLVCRSARTPKGGVEAQVVIVRDGTQADHYEGLNVRGKIVLTERQASAVARLAKQQGAVGIISDTFDRPRMRGYPPPTREAMDGPDAVQWSCLRDDPATKGMWGFVLSPRMGQRLRRLIEENESPVILRAEVDAESVPGHSDVVDAVVQGRGQEELWVLAHISEPGAYDNASGLATSIEIARTIKALVAGKAVPPPERTIRFLFSTEVTGFLPYLEQHKRNWPRVLAGLCLDSVGVDMGKVGGEFIIFRSPDYAPSFVEHLMAEITEAAVHMSADRFGEDNYSLFPWRHEDFWGNDAFVIDPYFDIPTPQVSCWPYPYYHTSQDRPEYISPDNLARTGVICGTFLYFLACASPREAAWLSALTAAKAKERTADKVRAEVLEQADKLPGKKARSALVAAARKIEQCAEYYGAVGRDAALQPGRISREAATSNALNAAAEGVTQSAETEAEVGRQLLGDLIGVAMPKPAPEREPKEAEAARHLAPRREAWRPPADADLPKRVQTALKQLRSCTRAKKTDFGEIWAWADGRRSVYEIWRQVRYKQPCTLAMVLDYFRLMAQSRYLELAETR